jgi:hypothetical protein
VHTLLNRISSPMVSLLVPLVSQHTLNNKILILIRFRNIWPSPDTTAQQLSVALSRWVLRSPFFSRPNFACEQNWGFLFDTIFCGCSIQFGNTVQNERFFV